MRRKGFTIVELLVVMGIIGILLGIISTAAIGAVRNGRAKRAEAMCKVLSQAISSYYAREGKWPDAIEGKAGSMGDKEKVTLSAHEADQVFRQIVEKSVGSGASAQYVDAHALFVAVTRNLKNNGEGCYGNHGDSAFDSYCGNKKCVTGMDFALATNPKAKKNYRVNDLSFGYQSTKEGKFSRFWIVYNGQTDSVTVSRKNPDKSYPEDWE